MIRATLIIVPRSRPDGLFMPRTQSLGRGPLGKADLAGSCSAGDGSNHCGDQSDGACFCDDLCEQFGDCCDDKAVVCDGVQPFNSCDNKECGESCTLCDPADPDCFETAVPKQCQPDGSCGSSLPECTPPFNSCGNKECGESCTLCDPADPDCFETAVPKQCQPDGSCGSSLPECTPAVQLV